MSEHINNFSKVAKKLHLLEILLTFIWPHICYNIDNVIKKTNLFVNSNVEMLHLYKSNDLLSYMKPSEPPKPHLIIMVGIPSSGKSFFAEHFADTFKAPIVSYDKLRKEIFLNPAFSQDENEIIRKVSDYVLSEVLKTKKTVIYEGQTCLRSERYDIAKKAHSAGYEPLLIWVQTETLAAQKRATKYSLEKPALSIDEFKAKLKKFSPPNKNEKAIVISGKHTYASQLKIVLKHLIQPHPEIGEPKNMIRTPKSRSFLIR